MAPCRTRSCPTLSSPPFRGNVGVRSSKTDSLTLNDFTYRLRLDDDGSAELEEQEFSYYDSALVATRIVKGTWTAIRVEPQKVVLRIADRILVLLPDDILCGPVEWGLKHHS